MTKSLGVRAVIAPQHSWGGLVNQTPHLAVKEFEKIGCGAALGFN